MVGEFTTGENGAVDRKPDEKVYEKVAVFKTDFVSL